MSSRNSGWFDDDQLEKTKPASRANKEIRRQKERLIPKQERDEKMERVNWDRERWLKEKNKRENK